MPHVNTKQEAQNVVNAAKFAPIGERGLFTSRQGYGVDNYFHKANDESLLIVLIEDIEAVKNLDEILEVNNIDVFFVAPNDLAATMGFIGRSDSNEVLETIDETLKKIVKAGRVAGTLTSAPLLDHYLEIGVKCICVNILPFLSESVSSVSKTLRSK